MQPKAEDAPFIISFLLKRKYIFCSFHYENTPMQYTEIFKVVQNENFQ